MISYQCECDSKYKNCNECPLKSREVFTDFARRLGHFYAWREVKITFKRVMPETVVCADDEVNNEERD